MYCYFIPEETYKMAYKCSNNYLKVAIILHHINYGFNTFGHIHCS